MRPLIGVETLLVYRECPCGDWCATGEGATAPICANCGGLFLPAVNVAPEYRRTNGLGFRARLANEIALAERKPIEDAVVMAARALRGDAPRYYDADLIRRLSDEINAAPKAEV